MRHGSYLDSSPADPPAVLVRFPARVYVEALSGRKVAIDGKVQCPFCDAATLHADAAEHEWRCSSCRRDGNIIAFAGYLYGLDPAHSYRELLDRLTSELLAKTDRADEGLRLWHPPATA